VLPLLLTLTCLRCDITHVQALVEQMEASGGVDIAASNDVTSASDMVLEEGDINCQVRRGCL
jgi:hypothetical protein